MIVCTRDRECRVQRSRGQIEHVTGLLVLDDVPLNVEGKLESEAFAGHLVHDPLTVVVAK